MPQIFEKVAVFGAGTMGTAIAQLCAAAGATVTICDPSPDAVRRAQRLIEAEFKKNAEQNKLSAKEDQALRERINYVSGLGECGKADLVIEAISERLDAKQELFARLDNHLPPPAVLATNTSTLSVTAIASKLRFPDRVCGLHFFNPPQRIKLVEVIAAVQTAPDTLIRCEKFVREIGHEPVQAQDTPGFIVNRCTRPFFGEALRCYSEGLADFHTIDEILKSGGFKTGAFEQMDLNGVDASLAAFRSIWEGYFHEERFRPHLLLKKMVEAGRLGKKSGRGFYEYPDAG